MASLKYCIEQKGLELNAWVIMSNHVHLVGRAREPYRMSDILRDFKKFTSKRIVEAIVEIPESRGDWLLDKFSFEARRTRRAENYKLWTDDNHAVDLTYLSTMEKVDYIHRNPVRAGLVFQPDQYPYSSAVDYAGGKGPLKLAML